MLSDTEVLLKVISQEASKLLLDNRNLFDIDPEHAFDTFMDRWKKAAEAQKKIKEEENVPGQKMEFPFSCQRNVLIRHNYGGIPKVVACGVGGKTVGYRIEHVDFNHLWVHFEREISGIITLFFGEKSDDISPAPKPVPKEEKITTRKLRLD